MSEKKAEKRAIAGEVWLLLHRLVAHRPQHFFEAIAAFNLTPGQARALLALFPDGKMAMGDLAAHFGQDPSRITRLVDQLEELGLVERQPHPTDRRIKAVVLTQKGIEVRTQLQAKLSEPPEFFEQLSEEELLLLKKVFQRLATPAPNLERA